MPRVVSDVKPRYTADAFRRRVNGSVFLECVVNREGVPTNVEVVTSLDEELDREALKALSQWRFEPGKKDGKDGFGAYRGADGLHHTVGV